MALNAELSTRQRLPSHVYPTLEVATSTLAHLISCYSAPGHPRHGPYVLAVEDEASHARLGHVGFSPLEDEIEVSYAIAEASRGLGIGTEAVVHACAWLVETFGETRVLALTASDNQPSRRLLERASFVHTHEGARSFQGRERIVSRYCWHAEGARHGA